MVDAATATEKAGTTGGIAHIVKPRQPPLWTIQKFDRQKVEITKWRDHGRGNYEEIFLDYIESLKKNEVIIVFVNRILIEIF